MRKYKFNFFFSTNKNAKHKSTFSIYDFLPNFKNDINADEVGENEAIKQICEAFVTEIRATDNKVIIDSEKGLIAVYDNQQLHKPVGYYFIFIKGVEDERN